ncbi:MAG: hypothetical protein GYB15_00765 [Gammaproteobacteria bacterium]|nr:hypothetical protein [Gammaproteobacteria bacterium]
MSPLIENVVIGIATGLISGAITGYYSGAIISRRVRFDTLQSDALRHLNSIEYIQEQANITVRSGSSSQLIYTASDFLHCGHRAAGEAVMKASQLVNKSTYQANLGQIKVAELEQVINEARNLVRSSGPTLKIYLPFGRM